MVAKNVKGKKMRKEEHINTEVSGSGSKKGRIQGCIAEGKAVLSWETCSSRFQLNQKRALRIAEPLQEDTKHSFHHPKKKLILQETGISRPNERPSFI